MVADSKTKKYALYAHLKKSIMTLAMVPGSSLDEAGLSQDFDLSRTPLREVFRDLAGEGYIDLHQNRGARVSEMSHNSLRDFFQAAPMIYGAIMRLAAQNASSDQIVDLKAAQSQFKSSLSNGQAADRALANNKFHEITGQMAGNIYLLPSFHRLLIDHARIGMTFYRLQTNGIDENLTKASAQHDDIIAAIEAKDEAQAALLADSHWALSRNQIESFVMPTGLDLPLGATISRAFA